MKKQLLFSAAFLLAINLLAQNGNVKPRPAAKVNMANVIAEKFSETEKEPVLKSGPVVQPNTSNVIQEKTSAPPSSINWAPICGSSSAYGMLNSNSRPLQYNPNVNAISFIHRKSSSYVETPPVPSSAKSGVLVAEISSNWGSTWDSTCIWADANNYGRYPQGGVYSAPGNTNISNAYVVGAAVAVSGMAYSGVIYSSKPIGVPGSTVFNSTADATPGAMQFFSTTSPTYNPSQCKHGWSRYGFSSTDDGYVRALALIEETDASPPRGVAIVKGTFNAGVFSWSTDSLIPPTLFETGGDKILTGDVQMAWNKAGTTGYVVMIGVINTASLSNKGFQPIVYKTTNSGASWSLLPGIDFNAASPEIKQITDHLGDVVSGTDTIGVPYFNNWDITVDSTDNLHIGALIASSYSSHNDSLSYTSLFEISINPGVYYTWPHQPGYRPYLYDFIGNGTSSWKVKIIDSLSTEDPGASPSASGFSLNPWDDGGTGGFKLNVDPRVQLGRTPNGNFVTFSWSESDTNFINNNHKFNALPNIKSRCMRVEGNNNYNLSPTEINVSQPAAGTGTINPNVFTRSTLHYMSPTTGTAEIIGNLNTFTVDINTPFTVTNSNPWGQITNNTTWYTTAKLSYAYPGLVGVKENSNVSSAMSLFPNPANGQATLSFDLKDNAAVNIGVYNLVGQKIKMMNVQADKGKSEISLDLKGLAAGVYLLRVNVAGENYSAKLVVE